MSTAQEVEGAGPGRGRVHVGTSGWAYRHWKGTFYPPRLPARAELGHLATLFSTVEVNGTFYGLTRPSSCDAWRAAVPPDFLFAVKGSRFITHMLKLAKFANPLANFFSSGIIRLGAQLGPLLWQLPPQLRFERARAEAFFAALPRDMAEAERWARRHDARTTGRAALTAPDGRDNLLRHALEVRDESWLSDESLRLMEAHGIALVAADSAGRFPCAFVDTAAFSYFRLHGSTELYVSGYSDAELVSWAARAQAARAAGRDVYVYFDNDARVHAPADARRLMEMLAS